MNEIKKSTEKIFEDIKHIDEEGNEYWYEINDNIFDCLSRLNADLTGINFDGKKITGLNFSNLNGVVINLDKVPDKDLSKVKFSGVTLIGTLNNAVIEFTDFSGYFGDIRLDPQTIKNKSIKDSNLSGVTIDGNLDDIVIAGVDFSKAKGDIVINPQKIPNKELIGINFANVLLCSSINEDSKEYVEPSFVGCTICGCKFKDLKAPIVINLDTLNSSGYPKLAICDLTGVVVEGTAKSNYKPIHCVKEDGTVLFDDVDDDLFGSYYYDEQGNYVQIHLYESMMWDDNNKCWQYILRENEYNLKFNAEFKKIEQQEKTKRLSLFRKK